MRTFRFWVWICRELHRDSQHSCVPEPLASNRPLPRACLCFCEPHLCQSETSFRSLDPPNCSLVSFVSFCGLLVLQWKSKLCSYKPPLKKAGWIQLEGVSFTPHVLQLLRINHIRCQGADWTNTTYQRIFSQICIQRPHFSRFMVTMTTRKPRNHLVTGQYHRAHCVNQGPGTWWMCCMAYDTMASLPCHPLSTGYIKVYKYRRVTCDGGYWGRLGALTSLGSVDDNWQRILDAMVDLLGGQTTLVPGNLSGHGSCSICIHVRPLPIWSNLFEDLGLGWPWCMLVLDSR